MSRNRWLRAYLVFLVIFFHRYPFFSLMYCLCPNAGVVVAGGGQLTGISVTFHLLQYSGLDLMSVVPSLEF